MSSQSVVDGHLSVLGRLGQDSRVIEVPLEFQSIRLEDGRRLVYAERQAPGWRVSGRKRREP